MLRNLSKLTYKMFSTIKILSLFAIVNYDKEIIKSIKGLKLLIICLLVKILVIVYAKQVKFIKPN